MLFKSCNPFSYGETRFVSITYVNGKYWCRGTEISVNLDELMANEKCKVTGNKHGILF